MGDFIKFRIKYPKLLIVLFTFILAYLIFRQGLHPGVRELISNLGYLGTLIAGMGFTYGFTAAPATAILLLISKFQNTIIAAGIAGFGSLLGDLLIFYLVRDNLSDEIDQLQNEAVIKHIISRVPEWAKKFLIPVFAGIIIASPLPDEIGIALLASSKHVSARTFSIASYLMNTFGILMILLIGRAV